VGGDGRHVERGGHEVVAEGAVEDHAALRAQVLHEREPEALRRPALHLALHGLGVDRPADVLDRGHLDQAHGPELHVDVRHDAVGGEGERRVAVALPAVVQRHGRPGAELALLLDDVRSEQLGQAEQRLARDPVGDRAPGQRELGRQAGQPGRRQVHDSRPDRLARRVDRPARDDGVPGGRRGARVADVRVGLQDVHPGHPELRAGDLRLDGHDALTDLARGGAHGGPGSPVASSTRSATRAVEKSSKPSEKPMFLIPTA
jgi:hypothetical protein